MGSFVQFFEEEVGGDDIWDQILEFIIKNPNPKESAIHEFAEEHNMAPDKLEEQVYENVKQKPQDEPQQVILEQRHFRAYREAPERLPEFYRRGYRKHREHHG